MRMSRREALMRLGAGTLAVPAVAATQAAPFGASEQVQAPGCSAITGAAGHRPASLWGAGYEGQRKADLGNGFYLNPIMAGDHPDPAVLKDGDDYYMTFSSFQDSPGLLIWHSRDLVNWGPVGPALPNPLGSVFAPDIAKHGGRYYIYIPFIPTTWSTRIPTPSIYVVHADNMRGPWSEPVDLGITGRIDPGHVVGEDGHRYLFLSGIDRVRLTPDGLKADGPVERVYDGWRYPDDWITEAYSLEGPKFLRRGDYFYLITAVGGTFGPPTGHMIIAARSRSIHGPWENCPHNPIVRTWSDAEAWWSRGHGTVVQGPGGDWWIVYHGYENGFRTLGRQTLLEPMEWTSDGWFRALGGDLSQPLAKPQNGPAVPHGIPLSDDFAEPAFGSRWSFYSPGADERRRARFQEGSMLLAGKGSGPHESSPLTQVVPDHSYEVTVALELEGDVQGGLLLFLSNRLFVGMGIDGTTMTTYGGGRVHHFRERAPASRSMHMRITNDRHIVTFYYSVDGQNWTRHGLRMETSGYNAGTILPGEGESFRPALFAAGPGAVRFRDYRYRALR
jgi:xylan 1,4-beta-xylosidase